MTENLRFSVAEGVARIVLDRPERMNAFTFEMIDTWTAALERCRTDDDVKVVIVTGTGNAFCSGGDVRMEDMTGNLLRRYLKRSIPILTGLSATYLYNERREFGERSTPDDVRGLPQGHFVVLCGYDVVERTVMGTLAVACVGTLAFGLWNWRGAFRATSETTAMYLELASSRLARFRRALAAGWILLTVEAIAFTIWLTYRATLVDRPEVNGAVWPWVLLVGMCGGAAYWLTLLGRWVRREASVVDDLRREYDDATR